MYNEKKKRPGGHFHSIAMTALVQQFLGDWTVNQGSSSPNEEGFPTSLQGKPSPSIRVSSSTGPIDRRRRE
jgi:hypothetical protein